MPASVTSLDDAMALILARPTGRINVRGANGSGKSTLLTILKSAVKTRAYYWPTADRLAFQFSQGQDEVETDEDGDPGPARRRPGFSSGERQLRALQEIVSHTGAPIYLLDEWDANLDPEQPRRRRRAGRTACGARPGGRDFAPGPDLKGGSRHVEPRRAALAGLAAAVLPAAGVRASLPEPHHHHRRPLPARRADRHRSRA